MMSRVSMVEAKLPPGFRFHPRDDELVCDYLLGKFNGSQSSLLIDVDLNKSEPWDIPACVGGKEWYFYSQRDKKYATGSRTNRATMSGYWKATGKDRAIVRRGMLVGMRKTLVFYQGRAPKGKKTEWIMHEFRVEGPFGPPKPTSSKEDWVLCRVFCKNKEDEELGSNSDNKYNINDYDEIISSTLLPPLTDHSYNVSFGENHEINITNIYQQVPCFSIYSDNSNPNPNPNILPEISQDYSNPNKNDNNNLGASRSDNKVIETVLSHLTKNENSPTSSESYLSELAFPPTMWNTHY